MIRASPVAEAPPRKSGRLIAAAVGVCFLLVLIYFFAFFIFTPTPPILVRVVDAVSGQPIAGIAVTQSFTIDRADGPSQQHTATDTTGSNGYVLFRPYIYSWPILAVIQYRIRVNEDSLASRPWRREVDLGPNQTDKYMPVTLEAHCPGCELLWRAPNPAAENLGSLWFVTVPLIPSLDSPDKCSSIANPTVSKQCKELTTYRSAFLHFDSVQDVENNKAICRRLEGQAAKTCLDELASYVAHAIDKPSSTNPSWFKPRQMPMLPTLPLEQVLPFDEIADRVINNRRICCNNPFTGIVTYIADYGRARRTINVTVDDYLTEDVAREAFSRLSSSSLDRNPKSTLSDEDRSGNQIKVYRTPHLKTAFGESGSETAFWRSANKVVTIRIFLPVPGDEEAVSKYLALYPSSLTQNDFTKSQVRVFGDPSPYRQ